MQTEFTRPAVAAIVAMGMAAASATGASAQVSAISAVAVRTDNANLGEMLGAGFRTVNPVRRGAVSLVLDGIYVAGSQSGFGSPCAGLVRPGTCEPESLRTTNKLGMMALGVGGFPIRRSSFQLHVSASATGGVAVTRTRGLASGDSRSGSETVVGATGGIDATWLPWRRSPVGLQLGVAATALKVPRGNGCVDCYLPFREGFNHWRLHLGVSYGRPVVQRPSTP